VLAVARVHVQAGLFGYNVATDVRGAGHWPQEETPQGVIDCVKLFFGPAGVPVPALLPALANCVALR
jgi:hypothetical protein